METPRKEPRDSKPGPTPSAENPADEPPVVKTCYSCAHSMWDIGLWARSFARGHVVPYCSNHPDWSGQMRRVPPGGPCRNWRPKPTPPVRLDVPPSATPGECKIALTKKRFASVDPEDFEWLSGFRWHATCSRGRYYAATVVHGKSISMHRMIMNPPPGMWVDHKNTDRLDNRRENLRLATPGQNRHNTRPHGRKGRPKSSQFLGVTRHGDRWKAKITLGGVEHFLGYFDDEIIAALTRDEKAKELHGEFAYLNFPDGPPPGYEAWKK